MFPKQTILLALKRYDAKRHGRNAGDFMSVEGMGRRDGRMKRAAIHTLFWQGNNNSMKSDRRQTFELT